MRSLCLVLGLLLCAAGGDARAQTQAKPAAAPIFRVQADGFWLNLHSFLYVLGRAEAGMPDIHRRAVENAPRDQDAGLARLTESERQVWREAVAAYAKGLSQKDAVFDKEVFSVTNALLTATDSSGIDVLDRAAPIYRKAWWPQHQKANHARADELQALVAQHGAPVLAYITRAYQEPWPADGFPVNLIGYSNWAGAYSTAPNLLVVSSLDPGTQGLPAFEIIFHESMHQWDDQMFEKLRAVAQRNSIARIPGGLTHTMIFYAAGEAVRSVVPSHVPYAEQNQVWASGPFATFKPKLDEFWKPYLAGSGTLDDALAGLLK